MSVYLIELHEIAGKTLLRRFEGSRAQARVLVRQLRAERKAKQKDGAIHERWES